MNKSKIKIMPLIAIIILISVCISAYAANYVTGYWVYVGNTSTSVDGPTFNIYSGTCSVKLYGGGPNTSDTMRVTLYEVGGVSKGTKYVSSSIDDVNGITLKWSGLIEGTYYIRYSFTNRQTMDWGIDTSVYDGHL